MASPTRSVVRASDDGPAVGPAWWRSREQVADADDGPGRRQQAVRAHPLVVVDLGEVVPAAVGEQDDDHRLARRPACRPGRGRPRGRRPSPSRTTRRTRIPSSRVRRRAIANASRSLTRTQRSTDRRVVRAREEVLADALGQVRPGGVAGQDAALRVRADHLDRRVLRLEVARRPGDRAAGPDARHEVGDPARRSASQISGPVVRSWAAGFSSFQYWSGLNAPGMSRASRAATRVVALGRLGGDVGRAQDDLGAVRPQELLLLRRLLVGHHEDAAIALERGRDRQAVAGVARRRLDDRAAGLEQARALGRLDHRQPDPVLDRAARVEHLELGQQQRLALDRAEVARDAARSGRAACGRPGRGSTRRTASGPSIGGGSAAGTRRRGQCQAVVSQRHRWRVPGGGSVAAWAAATGSAVDACSAATIRWAAARSPRRPRRRAAASASPRPASVARGHRRRGSPSGSAGRGTGRASRRGRSGRSGAPVRSAK